MDHSPPIEVNYFSVLPNESARENEIGYLSDTRARAGLGGSSSQSGSSHSQIRSSPNPTLILSPPLGANSGTESKFREKRRPSDLVISGLGLGIEENQSPAISPRLKRFYPPVSPIPSPSTSPYLTSAFLSSSSSSSSSTGLIQRVPRQSSKIEELPTFSPSLDSIHSPNLNSRASQKALAEEKAFEKAFEIEEKKKRKDGAHLRMFSWASRPEDLAASKNGGSRWKRVVVGVIGVIAIALLLHQSRILNQKSSELPESVPIGRTRRGNGLRRGAGGAKFIHPDVIDPHHRRIKPTLFSQILSKLLFSKPFVISPSNPKAQRSGRAIETEEQLYHKLFAERTPYEEHHPLPPPLEHEDSSDRDTVVLYRILGNDLPPRHSPGQTLRNLRFLLQYESDFSTLPHIGPHIAHHSHLYGSGSNQKSFQLGGGGLRVDKYFVLNRIADQEMLEAIVGLLKLYSVPKSRILILPFEWKEYEKRGFRWDGGIDELECWSIGNGEKKSKQPEAGTEWRVVEDSDLEMAELISHNNTLDSLRALDYIYHEKNLYAMNNNGGRNFALEHGRSLPNARWILPLDGNSFLTPAAMDSIVRTLSITGEGPAASRYLVIPMARLLSNEAVLSNNSIALLPKHLDETGSLVEDAELHRTSEGAPPAFEEPQIGFRFDATESYQPAMRYGRRSKLELLWRLGAIPYSRGLDKRTFPWEFGDREHITRDSWASIPGVMTSTSFSEAGWVYRLFSGDQSQEVASPSAVMLRNTKRIEGIIGFLERLDEKVSRGVECQKIKGTESNCGFNLHKMWSFDVSELEKKKLDFQKRVVGVVEEVQTFERAISTLLEVNTQNVSFQQTATDIGFLALAGYLTSNTTYSIRASDLISTTFISSMSLFHRQGDRRLQQLKDYQDRNLDETIPALAEESVAYAFPTIDFYQSSGPALPFDPLEFDPTILLDAFRLLSLSPTNTISRKSITGLFSASLSYLLYSPESIERCKNPQTPEIGAAYDTKVAALASFFNDSLLLGRVANRSRLRLSPLLRRFGLMGTSARVQEIHWALISGLSNVNFRPYNLIGNRDSGTYSAKKFGEDHPFNILGL